MRSVHPSLPCRLSRTADRQSTKLRPSMKSIDAIRRFGRTLWPTGGLLAAIWVVLISPPATASDKPLRPNVIIILADDLGYGDLSVQGHPLIRTPNIDRLAQEGQRWTSFYASAPVC